MSQALLGGLLPAIYSGADQLKRGVYGLLTNPQEQAERAAQSLLQSRSDRQALMARTFANPERPFQVTDQAGLAQLGTDVLTGELGIAPIGMIAYHGSPARFNKFDMSKVDTGEGAQFYGHGMYFAESPTVASQYMKNLGEYNTTVNGQIVDSPVAKSILRVGGDPEAFIKTLQNKINSQKNALEKASKDEVLPNISEYDIAKMELDSTLKMVDEAKSYIGKTIRNEPVGNLYKVDIPDESIPKMLNWDAPLSEQPKAIQDLVFKYKDGLINKIKMTGDKSIWDLAGADLYGVMQRYSMDDSGKLVKKNVNASDISKMLNESDVKGIQYMNYQGKTSEGANTPNYVVFDPETVKILERNGIPVEGLLD
jgi:hypothetical protein